MVLRPWLRTGLGWPKWSPEEWLATIVEVTTAADRYPATRGVDPDKHEFMTPKEARALEKECRRRGLIK